MDYEAVRAANGPTDKRAPQPRQPRIQISRNRSIELDREAKLKLEGVYPEIELVLLRLQRELCVDSTDMVEAGYYAKCMAKIRDEFQQITIEGKAIKLEENK